MSTGTDPITCDFCDHVTDEYFVLSIWELCSYECCTDCISYITSILDIRDVPNVQFYTMHKKANTDVKETFSSFSTMMESVEGKTTDYIFSFMMPSHIITCWYDNIESLLKSIKENRRPGDIIWKLTKVFGQEFLKKINKKIVLLEEIKCDLVGKLAILQYKEESKRKREEEETKQNKNQKN